MKPIYVLSFSVIFMAACHSSSKISYPHTQKENVTDHYFGTEVADPYRWLENDTSAATAAWVKAQNEVTFNYLEKIPFRNALKNRLTELNDYPKLGAPFKKHGKYYFFKNNGLQPQSILYQQSTLYSEPEILLDPNTLSSDGTVALSSVSFSNVGHYMAYSVAKSGSDWNEIFVLNLDNRQTLSDHIQWTKFWNVAWKGNGFYYIAYDAPQKGKELSAKNEFPKVYYHQIGQLQNKDLLIYQDKNHPLREFGPFVTEDEKYLFLIITETTTGNSLLMKDLSDPKADFVILVDGFENDYSVIDHINGKIYILTNWKAPNKRIMEIEPEHPSRENWKEVIPEQKTVLESVEIIDGKFFCLYLKDAAHRLFAHDLSGKLLYEVKLPTLGSVISLTGSKDDSEAFYTFSSFTFPPTIYRFDADKNVSEIFQKAQVKFQPENFVTEQVFYTAKDGTKVPMFLSYRKGMKKDGKNPLMLYGYGGFNISMTPSFSVSRIPFLESGGIYAVANIRGGGEYGESWHRAGTKMQKKNVFDDFIAAAEFLIAEGYTSSKKLAIDGGSNGGLLVGACLTQRPDLFAVAVPEVGVLDMLRYHLFTIGWSWASDYGTSEESKEMFAYLKSYSPLHNVVKGTKYPAVLIMTGDHDDRVVPAHSFKFAAALQEANASDKPVLIRVDSNAGHGAGKPLGKLIDAQTDMWSFVMYNLGMKPKW